MSENYLSEEQRTEEWYLARSGKFTGSRFVDVLKRKDCDFNDQSKGYKDLIYQIVLERLTGTFTDNSIDSASLRWGREYESEAKQYYMLEADEDVKEVGFLTHKYLSFVGVSPDGRIDKNGLEIKCPKSQFVHMARFVTGIEQEYVPQVQGSIWVCESDYWDWVSYDPRMIGYMKLFRQRIYRNDEYIKNLENTVLRAESDVRELLELFSQERIKEVIENFNRRIEA